MQFSAVFCFVFVFVFVLLFLFLIRIVMIASVASRSDWSIKLSAFLMIGQMYFLFVFKIKPARLTECALQKYMKQILQLKKITCLWNGFSIFSVGHKYILVYAKIFSKINIFFFFFFSN